MLPSLSEVGIFKAIPADGLAILETLGRRQTFGPGSALMRQGDPSETMHIILDGRVRVAQSRPAITEPFVLAELGPGEVVGEMGLLDHEPRSATVIAIEDTVTLELDASALAMTVLRYPEVSVALLQTFSQRLRSADELADQILRERAQQVAPQRPAPPVGPAPPGTRPGAPTPPAADVRANG